MQPITKITKSTGEESLIGVEEFLNSIGLNKFQPEQALSSLIKGLILQDKNFSYHIKELSFKLAASTLQTHSLDRVHYNQYISGTENTIKIANDFYKLAKVMLEGQSSLTAPCIFYDKKRKGFLFIDTEYMNKYSVQRDQIELVVHNTSLASIIDEKENPKNLGIVLLHNKMLNILNKHYNNNTKGT